MLAKTIYQIYAELQEYKPKVWRRFQVTNDITMSKLAYILMTLFEMKGSHLYMFEVNELDNFIINNLEYYNNHLEDFKDDDFFKIAQYGCIFEDDDIIPNLDKRYRELKHAKDVKLKWILGKENERMEFRYDFGDNWSLNIILEKVFKDENIQGRELPKVIEGQGFGVIEDCGGTMGLEDIRKAFKEMKGEDYEMYSNWLGVKTLELDNCDLDDLNFRLKKLPRILKNMYEYELEPTEREIKVLERDYKKND